MSAFHVGEGEILGVYGLLGAGRTELVEALAGLRPIASGVVAIRGQKIRTGSVREALKAGMVLMPEDRQRDGLFPELSIRENVVMAAKTGLILSRDEETKRVRKLAAELHIAAKDHRASRDHAFGRKSAEGSAGALPDVLAVGSVDG